MTQPEDIVARLEKRADEFDAVFMTGSIDAVLFREAAARIEELTKAASRALELADMNTRTTPPPAVDEGLVARLEELLAKATPGPWYVGHYWTNSGTPDERVYGMLYGPGDRPTGVIDENQAPDNETLSHDLALIVEAVNALPLLLSALRNGVGQHPHQAASAE